MTNLGEELYYEVINNFFLFGIWFPTVAIEIIK